jgi:hypothetical protein
MAILLQTVSGCPTFAWWSGGIWPKLYKCFSEAGIDQETGKFRVTGADTKTFW